VKSKRVKQILLVLLFVVLVYIWWGNFMLLFTKQDNPDYSYETSTANQKTTSRVQAITFREPKVNPFRRYDIKPTGNQQINTPETQPPLPEFLHIQHKLNGILPKGKTSQIIVLTPQSKSVILEMGDSLSQWQLTSIGDSFAIFKQGKRYDTLRLGPQTK
jgi:hypothetical protein